MPQNFSSHPLRSFPVVILFGTFTWFVYSYLCGYSNGASMISSLESLNKFANIFLIPIKIVRYVHCIIWEILWSSDVCVIYLFIM